MTDSNTGLQVFSNKSFFDSIKHIDEQGQEYWLARELMPLLGYKQWQKFKNVIDLAQENLEIILNNSFSHFISMDNLVKRPQGGGTKALDYKLTRLACYHVALCSDSRGNNHVRLAKHYFAVKTREAELTEVKPKTALELAKEQVKLLEQLEIQAIIIADQEKDLERQAEVIDELFNYSSIIRVATFNDVTEKCFNWRILKAISQKMKAEIKQTVCPRYGTKNLYSHDVWRYAYPNYQLPETTTVIVKN